MTLGQDASKIKVNAWAKVRWMVSGQLTDLGFTGKPTVKITPEYSQVTTGQTGKLVLDDLLVGAGVEIVTPLLQPDLELIRGAIVPWAAGSGSIDMLPARLGEGLYQYAGLLNLHPLTAGDEGEVEDNTMDFNFLKAVPTGALTLERDGTGMDIVPVTWRVYPDRAQLPAIVIGHIGDIPS